MAVAQVAKEVGGAVAAERAVVEMAVEAVAKTMAAVVVMAVIVVARSKVRMEAA